jgi:DNA-binding CsgD family transcriptional regulator
VVERAIRDLAHRTNSDRPMHRKVCNCELTKLKTCWYCRANLVVSELVVINSLYHLTGMDGRRMIHDAPETDRHRLRRLLDSLTKRQSQCACWAFRGMSNKEIGHEIGCATRTVKSHLSKVYARLGLQPNSALAKRAMMVRTMIDTSKHQEAGAEMNHLFSPHQIDVLDLVSEGLKNKEIARCLSMSENMIKHDLRRIFDLAGCDTRVQVVVWWRNHRRCGEGTVNSKRDGQSAPLLCTPNLRSNQASNQLRT